MAAVTVKVLVYGLMALVPRSNELSIVLVDAADPPLATDGCDIGSHVAEVAFFPEMGKCVSPCTPFDPPFEELCGCVLKGDTPVSFLTYGQSGMTRKEMEKDLELFPIMGKVVSRADKIGSDISQLVAARATVVMQNLEVCRLRKEVNAFSCEFGPLTEGDGPFPHEQEVAEAFVADLLLYDPKIKVGGKEFPLELPYVFLVNISPAHEATPSRCARFEERGRHFELFYDLARDWPPRMHFRRHVPRKCDVGKTDLEFCFDRLFANPAGVEPAIVRPELPRLLLDLLSALGRPICTMAVFSE